MNIRVSIPARSGLRRIVRATLGCFLLSALPLAAQPTFVASVESPEVVAGSRFEVAFALKNGEGANFRPPAFANFKVISGPNLTSGMTFVKGNYLVHSTWSYELEAKTPGKFAIGAAKVSVNGRSLSSNPLTIRVVAGRNGSGSIPVGAAEDLFIVGELSTAEAWVGQQITYWVKLYTLLTLEGYDLIELPDFQGFYAKEKIRFDTRLQYQTIKGKKYAVKILHAEAIFPQESGEQTVGVARVRVGVERSGPLGMLGPLPQVLQTLPIRLQVKPLPEPAPAPFSGGVGQYEWLCTADRDSLSTDDALTLTVRLSGNGDPKRLTLPIFTLPAGLEAFEPKVLEEEEYENGQQIVHRKTLEYALLPKEPGDYDLRPEWVVFDPDSNRYVTLQVDTALHFRVSIGKNYQANQPGIDTLPIALPPGIFTSGWWQQAVDWLTLPWVWGGLAALASLLLIFSWTRRQRESTVGKTAALPLMAPIDYQEQFGQARQLLHSADPRLFYDALLRGLHNYLSKRLALSPAQLSVANVHDRLTRRQVPANHIQSLFDLWQTCEQAIFAGQTGAGSPEISLRTAEQLLHTLERDLTSSL